MQNQPHSGGNPSLPADAELAKKARDDKPEGEVDKSEEEKEQDTIPEDKESFNIDKVDDLEETKKGEKED